MFGEKIYCSIDVGAQKIKIAFIRVKENKELELVATAEARTRGFKDSSVSDLGEFSDSIQSVIDQIVRKYDLKLKEIHLGINGELVDAREINTVIPLVDKGSKVIGQRDLKKVNEQACLLGLKMEEEILHELPQYYKVDDVNMALNPQGLFGRKLGVHSIIVVTGINRIRNINKAINQAGYDVGSLAFGSFAASCVCLTDQEKTEGSILVDIGSRVTSIMIFKGGVLKFLSHIQIGGDHFTQAIAQKLNVTFELAEEIKKTHGSALADHHPQEEVLIKQNESYLPIRREAVHQAIAGELDRLVGSVQMTIKESGLYDQINGGITFIGGGSLLPGLIERIGQDVNMSSRLGKMNGILQRSLCNAAIYAPVVGVAVQSYYNAKSFLMNNADHEASWPKRVSNKIKELYFEYF